MPPASGVSHHYAEQSVRFQILVQKIAAVQSGAWTKTSSLLQSVAENSGGGDQLAEKLGDLDAINQSETAQGSAGNCARLDCGPDVGAALAGDFGGSIDREPAAGVKWSVGKSFHWMHPK